MKYPEVNLSRIAAIPITNGLGEPAADGEEDWPRYIRTTDIAGLFSLDPSKRVTLPPEVAAQAPVEAGDILMTAAGSLGTSYLADGREPSCYAGYLVRLRCDTSRVNCRYAAYWTQSTHHLDQIATGAVKSTIDNFSAGKFRQMRMPLPPLEEQRRIADFLDDQVARINEARLLRSKQLELLDEMRSASLTRILHSAPGRPMRIAWLLKRSPSYGVLKPEHYDGPDGVPIVRIFNMPKHGEIDVAELMRISPGQDKEYARTRLAPGDVLLSVVGTIGRVAIVGDALNGANLSRAVARLEPRAPWQAPLIATWLQSQGFARFVDETTQGTAQSVLNMGDLARFRIVMPESREIALKVADRAVEHLRDGQDVAAGVRQAMEILEEYRSSLITAAVTGEFDVTTARRGIPA